MMWKSLGIFIRSSSKTPNILLNTESILQQQLRTTYILKRRTPPLLHKKGHQPKKLRSRHYVYDLVKQTHVERQPNIDVILTAYVEGLGNAGDKVSVKPNNAYNNLLLPGLAIYASPENLRKYEDYTRKTEEHYSSPNALLTVKILSRILLSVVMNKDVPWTLQPWHVKSSFRKSGYIVAEEAITLPEKPIKGPDINIENKEFFVTLTINNQEKVNVRCRIHHWSTNISERLPFVPNFFYQPSEPIFPEQASVLEALPKKPIRNIQ